MSRRRFDYNSRITGVRFSVSGTEDVISESDIPITSFDLFKNGVPCAGGVYDGHLGTTDHTYRCQTCFNNKKFCLGHDGHLALNYPVVSPLFLQEVKKWLRLICFNCGNSIVDLGAFARFPANKRLDEASRVSRPNAKACVVCKTPHPAIVRDKDLPLLIKTKMPGSEEENPLYPHEIAEIFSKISEETVMRLGKNIKSHPRKFILSAVKVPPTTIRPDTKKNAMGRSMNNELTTLIQNVIRKNEKLPTVLPDEIDAELAAELYALADIYHTFIRGPTGKKAVTGGGSVPLNSLAMHLRGKGGIHRKHQQGKRVKVVARTTITGDPTLKVNQVGVPLRFAKILQIEEVVQEFNRKRLMINFLNGKTNYPGCSKIKRKATGAEHSVDNPHGMPELEIGDVIYRDLQDGDYVLYNRQPSLLPSSISGMEVVVTMDPEILTFRMNVISCPLFNADFDGDQMNMYIGRSLASRIEIERHSGVHNWFIKHASSATMVGQKDDSIIGSFMFTRSSVRFTKRHAMLVYAACSQLPLFSSAEYTGRDLISMCLENTPVNLKGPTNYYKKAWAGLIDYDPNDTHVVIERGKHVRGVFDKKTVGKDSVGGLYHLIAMKYGEKKALDVIHDMQQLALGYMHQCGFTIGIHDILLSKKSLTKIHSIETGIIEKSRYITERLNAGKIIPPVGKTIVEFYEEQQIATLRIMDDFTDPILESTDTTNNNLMQLVLSGSKGSVNHVCHIGGAIGQIVINDVRPKQQFAYGRTFAHFPRFDTEPSSRGFILNSYISGMNAAEFAFNAQNARADFITKALYTSVTGESERKSMKNLESIVLNNMRMCVKYQNIVQLLYGEDGLDPRKVIQVTFPTIMCSSEALVAGWKTTGEKFQAVFDAEFARVVEDREQYRKIFLNLEQSKQNELFSDSKYVPTDIEKLIADMIYQHGVQTPNEEELAAMVLMVDEFCSRLPYVFVNEIQEQTKADIPEHLLAGMWISCVYIRSILNSKHSLVRFNKIILEDALGQIKLRHARALCAYGTAVGVIAAMSFSEPLTQYMLDAHHRTTAGGSSKSAMTTVREVLGARETDRLIAPVMMLVPFDEYQSEGVLNTLANHLEMMEMRMFVRISQIFFEKFGEIVHPAFVHENESLIGAFVKQNPVLKPPNDLLRWCIRFTLDKYAMIYKNMTLETIITCLRDNYPDAYIVYNPENSKQLVLRVYIRAHYFRGHVEQDAIETLRESLLDTVVRGVPSIRIATPTKLLRNYVAADDSIQRVKDKFCITTTGTNIAEMMKIKAIDPYQITTDAIDEIQKVFGIEAARQQLFTSIRNLGAGGLNMHHVSIYVDEMTYTGVVTSIEKQGLNKREANNVLLRMGFAGPVQTLEEAAINAMDDPVQGITSPLLVGDVPQTIGTAYNSFHINENIVKQNTIQPDEWLDDLGFD